MRAVLCPPTVYVSALDDDAHGTAGAADHAAGSFQRSSVQVGHLGLSDLFHLSGGQSSDLFLVGLAGSGVDASGLLDQNGCRRSLGDEAEGAVSVDGDDDGDDITHLVLGISLIIHKREEDGITEEELVTMVDQAENEGGLDEHESELIRNAIEFHDLEVSEILTPRVDIVAAEENSTMEEVGSLFAESGYSRLPIYQDSIDNIVGVIHEKDFYAARYRGETMISALKAPVLYTTGNTKISELMRILQRNKAHMAVVVDEYGGTEGIATLEDIVEELVGDIWDEHDEVIEEFKKQEDGSYLIACSADLDDMFDLFAVKGACAATTVSGWVMEQVGRVPEEGDHFQAEGLDVIVTRVEHRRVIEIQVRVLPEEEPETK